MGLRDFFKPKKTIRQTENQPAQKPPPQIYSFIDSSGKKCDISIIQETREEFSQNQQEVAKRNSNSKLFTAKIGYSQDHGRFNLNNTVTFGCCDLSLLECLRDGQQPALAEFFKEFFSEKRVAGKLNNEQVNGDYIGSILYLDKEHTQIDKFINQNEQKASVVRAQQQRKEEEVKKTEQAAQAKQEEQRRAELFKAPGYKPQPPRNRNLDPEIKKTSPEGHPDAFSFIDTDGYIVNLNNVISKGKATDGFQLYSGVISHVREEGHAAKFKDVAFELPAKMESFIKDPNFAEVAAQFFSKSRVDRINISDKQYIGGLRKKEGPNEAGWQKVTNPEIEKLIDGKNMARGGR